MEYSSHFELFCYGQHLKLLKGVEATGCSHIPGKNVLLPQERKLIGKSKHFEISLG